LQALLVSFFNLASRPRFATYRGSDVVQLIGIGMCFGVALATMIVFVQNRRAR
jgi:hypothetical protein